MGADRRRLDGPACRKVLAQGRWGTLCTVSRDGAPYGVPLNYVVVPDEDALYCHCAPVGRKLRNIAENPRVSFAVVGWEQLVPERFITNFASVMVEGQARLVADGNEKRRALLALCGALAPGQPRRDAVIDRYLQSVAIIRIDIFAISGRENRDDQDLRAGD